MVVELDSLLPLIDNEAVWLVVELCGYELALERSLYLEIDTKTKIDFQDHKTFWKINRSGEVDCLTFREYHRTFYKM